MSRIDDLKDDDLGQSAPTVEQDLTDIRQRFASANRTPDEFQERCPKCSGSGRFTSYAGRSLGQCFACKGVGYKVFKTSHADRAKAKLQREEREERKAADWHLAHPGPSAWLRAKAATFDFAASMLQAVSQYATLTERQLAAVERCMANDAQRDATRAIEQAQRQASAPVADISKIEAAFQVARDKGLKRIKVRLGTFVFKPAPETGKNPGAVYVTTPGAEGEYLGKVLNGRLLATRECGEERQAAIVRAAADPLAAAIAYGKEFGQCAVCGRELSDPVSIERGIGPICAGKFNW